MKLLKVEQLDKTFESQRNGSLVHAVSRFSFSLSQGEFLGLVGESGCGKSTVAKMLAGILPPDAGKIWLDGIPLSYPYPRTVYRNLQMIFQMPRDSFNPRQTLGRAIETVLRNGGASRQEAERKVLQLLDQVGLPSAFQKKYPHQVSGGECQRAAIARALAASPRLLICDEITSALDVTVQAQIVGLLQELRENTDLAVLFISHDLALVQGLCSRILVMNQGVLVEEGATQDVLQNPRDPYTRLLRDSVLTV